MSLVPDYSSSSEDEAPSRVATPAVPTAAPSPAPPVTRPAPSERAVEPTKSVKKPKMKKKKKTKTTLHLPPEIQRLLESGTLGSDDSDDDGDSLLAKQKRAVAKRPRAPAAKAPAASQTTLSFLPAPKHHIEEPKPTATFSTKELEGVEDVAQTGQAAPVETAAQSHDTAAYAAHPEQQYYDPQQQYYDPQQYAQYYAQYYQDQQEYAPPEQADEPTSKRARHRDRELERMLQMGQFNAVADKIVEVAAPAPDAWQAPPVEQLQKGSASELKVKASFWNSSAGTAVASVKPSRLQRQKHQLNQLAFDAKAREFELLDRKGAAIKTKRETHAKYGW